MDTKEIARKYAVDCQMPVIGYTIFNPEGKPFGWSRDIPHVSKLIPGCVAVCLEFGHHFELEGGNDMDGGQYWICDDCSNEIEKGCCEACEKFETKQVF